MQSEERETSKGESLAGRRWSRDRLAMLSCSRLMPGLAAVSLLAACASLPPESASVPGTGSSSADVAIRPVPSTQTRPFVQKRGGGYYKDDGPGENPPARLAEIPDAQPRFEPLLASASRPYTALGYSFTPMTQLQPFSERGLASWYGRRFHGARTSSGEPYDMYGMTAAHPTLPIPSYARVTNVGNGRTVVVRVNDRGPFHSNRVMDLSYTAAWKLGYVDRGSAEVLVEAIVPDELDMLIAEKAAPGDVGVAARPVRLKAKAAQPQPPRQALARAQNALQTPAAIAPTVLTTPVETAPVPPDVPVAAAPAPAQASQVAVQEVSAPRRGIFLQLGAFSLSANAENFREQVRHQLKWLREEVATLLVEGKYRLHVGPFNSAGEARKASERIARSLSMQPFLVER